MSDRNASANSLIAAMDDETAWAVLDASERVDLAIHHRLEAANTPISHAYFMETGVASIVAHSSGNLQIEAGLVGKEGMVGTSMLSGFNQSPHDVFIQIEGSAHRVPMNEMQRLIHARPALQALFIRYMQTVHVQLAATALANGRATIIQFDVSRSRRRSTLDTDP